MGTELRKSGISVLGNVPWGLHFCYFYETKQDLLDSLVPYFQSGLENKEYCLWLISDPLTVEEARGSLRRAVRDLDRYLAEQNIEIIPNVEWSLQSNVFDPDRVMRAMRDKLDQAFARGYAGMRFSGNPGWLKETDPSGYVGYERSLDELTAKQPMLVSHTYPLQGRGALEVFGVLSTHKLAGTIRQGTWEVIKTVASDQAMREIVMLKEEFEQRVVARTGELAVANEELKGAITAHARIEEGLKNEMEILQKIFDHIPVMINFIDEDGRIRLVNREWERVLGWSLEEIQRQNLDIFAECYPDPAYRQQVLDFVASASGEWADFRTRLRDGRVIDTAWVEIRLSDGTVIGIGQDITARKAMEGSLKATTEQLRALSASLSSAREEEGTRIARELHDELGSALTSLRWELEEVARAFSEGGDQVSSSALREKLASMTGMTDAIIRTVRRIAAELRPSILDDLGLVAAIEWQAQQFESRTGIACGFDSFVENAALSREQATEVFRICQEALTNILRHAKATKVTIVIRQDTGEFLLEVSDNGRGITEEEKAGSQSLGLIGMRERARLAGGAIEISGVAGKGTSLAVRIPMPTQAAP